MPVALGLAGVCPFAQDRIIKGHRLSPLSAFFGGTHQGLCRWLTQSWTLQLPLSPPLGGTPPNVVFLVGINRVFN